MKITIVGNMSFLQKFEEAKEFLQEQGHKVIMPEKDPMPEPIPPSAKRKAIEKLGGKVLDND